MKIYVVTSGDYSDYAIQKVFTDENKAKEYAEWLDNSNDIEEYETEDDLQVNKFYKVSIALKVYDNGTEELSKYFTKIDYNNDNYTFYSDYHKYGSNHFALSITRIVNAENWNEEFYINKYVKAIYDISARVKALKSEGFTESQIKDMLNS